MLFSYRKCQGKITRFWEKKKKGKKEKGKWQKKTYWKFNEAFGYRPASPEAEKKWACRNEIASEVAAAWGATLLRSGSHCLAPTNSSAYQVFIRMVLLSLCPLISWSPPNYSDACFDGPGPQSHFTLWTDALVVFLDLQIFLSLLWPLSLTSAQYPMQPTKYCLTHIKTEINFL